MFLRHDGKRVRVVNLVPLSRVKTNMSFDFEHIIDASARILNIEKIARTIDEGK